MRPLGALLFGTIGDVYGRNVTLRIAIICMAVSGGGEGQERRCMADAAHHLPAPAMRSLV